MTIDLGATYRAARLRVAALANDELADRPVPATPAWDVHDVVAHLAGVMHDVAAGNMEGAATEPWTAAQVERGRGKTVAGILDEWAAGAAGFEDFLSSPDGRKGGSAVVDVQRSRNRPPNCAGSGPSGSRRGVGVDRRAATRGFRFAGCCCRIAACHDRRLRLRDVPWSPRTSHQRTRSRPSVGPPTQLRTSTSSSCSAQLRSPSVSDARRLPRALSEANQAAG